jgi:hypothetical protein
MDEFKDLVGELPVTPVRVGYEPRVSAVSGAVPPRLPQEQLKMKS